jgi:hypothetical protein
MKDEQMDEMLIEGARDYNEPGPVPRDEMWSRIQAARSARSGNPAGTPTQNRPHRLWVWASIGLAAASILAVGVVIGRRIERPTGAAVAVTPPASRTPPSDSALRPAERVSDTAARVASRPDSLIEQLHRETRRTDRRVQELATVDAAAADTARSPGSERVARQESSNLAYRLVVLQHLAGSEAMITAFRATARRGETDAQIATWSRELLSTTRLLEASPASDDPMMKRLLEDLELVITQIVQYATHGTNSSDELDLIEQSINKRGVMTKLRSTLPARTPASGT